MAGLQPQCKVFPHNALLFSQRVDSNRIARTKNLNASTTMYRIGFYIKTRRIFKEKNGHVPQCNYKPKNKRTSGGEKN